MKMFTTRPNLAAMVSAALITSASSLIAAPIAWGPVSGFERADQLINNGAAVDTWARADVTVNGLAFVDPETALGTFESNGAFGAGFNASTGDVDFDTLTGSHTWDGGKDSSTITLTGLTDGQVYTFQGFFVDNRGCCDSRQVVLGDNSGGTPSAPVARSPGLPTLGGNTIFGTFTADNTGMQEVTVSTSDPTLNDGSLNNGFITGYVLSEGVVTAIPEPTSAVLVGLAVVGGLGVARRSRV